MQHHAQPMTQQNITTTTTTTITTSSCTTDTPTCGLPDVVRSSSPHPAIDQLEDDWILEDGNSNVLGASKLESENEMDTRLVTEVQLLVPHDQLLTMLIPDESHHYSLTLPPSLIGYIDADDFSSRITRINTAYNDESTRCATVLTIQHLSGVISFICAIWFVWGCYRQEQIQWCTSIGVWLVAVFGCFGWIKQNEYYLRSRLVHALAEEEDRLLTDSSSSSSSPSSSSSSSYRCSTCSSPLLRWSHRVETVLIRTEWDWSQCVERKVWLEQSQILIHEHECRT